MASRSRARGRTGRLRRTAGRNGGAIAETGMGSEVSEHVRRAERVAAPAGAARWRRRPATHRSPGRRGSRRVAVALALALCGSAAPAAAAEGGLVLVPDPRILVLLLAVFVGLRYVLHPLLVAPLERVLEEREARIEGARREAARIGEEAERLHGQYREAVGRTRAETEEARRRTLAEARSEQLRITQEARAEAERETVRARQEVEAALAEARGGLRGVAEVLAREAAERILGRSLS